MTQLQDMEALRLAAEAQLKHRCSVAEASAKDAVLLLHELQVHQVELEMQNIALLDTRDELEAALASYTALYDFAPVGYFSLDQHGAIRQLNLAGAKLLGSNRLTLLGRVFASHVDKPDHAVFAETLALAASSDVHANCDIALTCQSPSARQVFVHIEIAPGTGEEPLHVVATDVTAAKQATADLNQQKETLRSILETTPDLVYSVDRQYRLLFINRVPAGLSMAEALNTDITDYVAPEQRQRVRNILRQVFETGVDGRFEVVARGEDDRPTWYETVVAPVFNGAEVVNATLLSRDITERIEGERRFKALSLRLVEAQEAARRDLTSMLHDRTSANLAALGINLDITEMALQTRDWSVIAERMGDNRALLDDTVASVREICTELRPPALDYAGLAPALESYTSQYAKRTGIAVRLDLSDQAVKLTPEIESTLFRIVQEALTNVAKHAAAKTVSVRLKLDRQPLRLIVADDGCGFDPLQPGDQGGLGIITMGEMAEFIGSRLTLQTSPGNGVRISVDIPLTELPV